MAPPQPDNAIHVCVVDDDTDLREMVSEAFAALGCQVTQAKSGNEAWAKLQKTPCNLVVTDMNMSDGNGMELLDLIRAKNPSEPKVFVISGFSDFSVPALLDHGADGFINKPFGAIVIRDMVKVAKVPAALRFVGPNREPVDSNWSVELQAAEAATSRNANKDLSQHFKLGRGGFSWRLPSFTVAVGKVISFKIQFKSGSPTLEGFGRVLWTHKPNSSEKCAGIEFIELQEPGRTWVIQAISGSPPIASIPSLG